VTAIPPLHLMAPPVGNLLARHYLESFLGVSPIVKPSQTVLKSTVSNVAGITAPIDDNSPIPGNSPKWTRPGSSLDLRSAFKYCSYCPLVSALSMLLVRLEVGGAKTKGVVAVP
jgi:hypothetical protein